MSAYKVINSRARRVDTPAKATGKAVFVDDISKPGMLYGALLQSPLAHAKILNIDTSAAEKLPGVKCVVTAKEAGLVKYGVSPARYDETLFCHEKVRYIGDEIAAIAAVDLETAIKAVELIKVDCVRLASGDTDMGVDLGAYSSRQPLMTCHAAKEAGEDVRRQVVAVLADELNLPAESIDIQDGYIVFDRDDVDFSAMRTRYIKEHRGWTDNPDSERLTFKEASRIAYLAKGSIVGTGKYKPQFLGGKYKGAAVGTSPAYGCSAQMVEVDVDLETGQVTIEHVVDAHDCGKAINRTSVEGQMQGSVSMGIGEAMHEEVKFDDKGHVINNDLAEYKLVTALDMPPVEAIVVETNEPNGPFGAKEVGEGAIMPTIPAVLNAVYDATGVRFFASDTYSFNDVVRH